MAIAKKHVFQIWFIGKIKKPIEIIIKNGYAQNVPLSKMKSLVKDYGKKVLSVAELGIGLNPKARWSKVIESIPPEIAINKRFSVGNNSDILL